MQMTDPTGIPALVDAIRHMHGVEAKHLETTHVREEHQARAASAQAAQFLVFFTSARMLALTAMNDGLVDRGNPQHGFELPARALGAGAPRRGIVSRRTGAP